MERLIQIGLVVVTGGLGGFALPRPAWAHHSGPGAGGGPWVWLSLLVLILAFGAMWAISSFLERRQARRTQRQKPPSA